MKAKTMKRSSKTQGQTFYDGVSSGLRCVKGTFKF